MIYVVYAIVAILVILIAVLLIRAVKFVPAEVEKIQAVDAKVNTERAVKNLSTLVQIPTISVEDTENGDYSIHEIFIEKLQSLYPNIEEKAKFERVAMYGLIFKIEGESSEKPTVLMSHYDVVPVAGQNWTFDPFSGEVVDGYVLGRGTIDTKGTLVCTCEAVETMLEKGFVPQNDIYLCFGGDEELGGDMCKIVVEHLKNQGVRPALVFDEGGAVVEGVFPGVASECALIGISEKGLCDIQLTVNSSGGHASSPNANNPVTVLAKAICNIEKNQMKSDIIPALAEMLDALGRHSSFVFKIIFANMWLFKPLVKKIFVSGGGETSAMCKTTFAFTKIEGSKANNVLPTTASMVINVRVLNNVSSADMIAHIKKVVNDERVEVKPLIVNEPSPVTSVKSDGYLKVKNAIGCAFPEAIVSPYIMVAASDSRHFSQVCDCVLKFDPFRLSKAARATIHSYDEKISVKNIEDGVNFYLNLVAQL